MSRVLKLLAPVIGLALVLSKLAIAAEPGNAPARAVVHISGYMSGPGGESSTTPFAQASGFVLDDDGGIVSVASVFTERERRWMCDRFSVRLADGQQLAARTRSVDPVLNLLVLDLLREGDRDALATDFRGAVQPGDEVTALAGADSERPAPRFRGQVLAQHKQSIYGAGLGDLFIDSRMRLPRHAYGGPLLNARGDVIGINTPNIHHPNPAELDPDESHALPTMVVRSFVRLSRRSPSAAQTWLGLAFRPLTRDEQQRTRAAIGRRAGLMVDFSWVDGPAGAVDIRPGDVLLAIDRKQPRTQHDLAKHLRKIAAGEKVTLALLRGGKILTREVRTVARPDWAGYVHWRHASTAG